MRFMAIERFRHQDARSVYRRLRERGRLLPDGLTVLDSFVQADLARCFQLLQTDDAALLQRWAAAWADLVEFEIVPVATSQETAAVMDGSS